MLKTYLRLLVTLLLVTPAAAADFNQMAQESRKFLKAMIEANTTNPPGAEAKIAALVAEWLKAEGIPFERTEFEKGRENIVARLKGSGPEKPVMLLAHTDVVGAEGQKWSVDPHQLTEKDGFLYGRGTSDMLSMAAVNLSVFLTLARAKTPLKRDLILAMTGDEESGGKGIQYLLKHKPESVAAGFVLNEGGRPILGADDKVRMILLQVAEKTYQDYTLTATGKTGHSSVPQADNAIIRLSAALARLGPQPFPPRLIPVTRAYFAARAKVETGKLAQAMKQLAESSEKLPEEALAILGANPVLAAYLRTTCIPTLLKGGTRENALPATATANVNCRILPDESLDQVQAYIQKVLHDTGVTVHMDERFNSSGPSPLDHADLATTQRILGEVFPGAPVIPTMGLGASDSRFLRSHGIPAYGLSPVPLVEQDGQRAHGVDERIPVNGLRTGVELYYRLVSALAAKL